MVFPAVLGTGKRLFEGHVPKTNLHLIDNKPVGPDGVVLMYEPTD